jgi:sugar lactone lactonase YvrE
VDLGTEFAVEVKSDFGSRKSAQAASNPTSDLRPPTSTEVHVLQGEVSVQPATSLQSPTSDVRTPTLLKAGEAVVSERNVTALRVTKAEPARFVRELPAEEPGTSPGDILAVSRRTLKLVKIDPKTGEQKLLAQGNRDQHGTDWMCVAVNKQGQVLVGTDQLMELGGSQVLRIDPRDGAIRVLARGGLMAKGRISGIAIAPDGKIYATQDGVDDKILTIDPKSGAVAEFATFGNNAWGIAIDVNGRDLIAVSDWTGTVARLDGKAITPWVFGNDTKGVRGVAVRPDGRVFISISSDQQCRIAEVDRDTRHVSEIVHLPSRQNNLLGMLAVEAGGRLIVADNWTPASVYRVDVEARTITPLATGGHLSEVLGVAVVPELRAQTGPNAGGRSQE